MKLILWGSTPESPTAQRLIQEAHALKRPLEFFSPRLSPHLPSEPSVLINRFTALDYNDDDLYIAIAWSAHNQNHRVHNDPKVTLGLRDKFRQYETLTSFGLPCVITYPLKLIPPLDHYSEDQKFVVKPLRSNGGRGLILIHGKESLFSVQQAFHDLRDERFVVQPRLNKLREFRLFAWGLREKKNFLWIERLPLHKKEYRGNRSYTEERLLSENDLSTTMLELQKTCDESFPTLLYWGADVVEYLNERGEISWGLFELNTSPGIIGPESLTKRNIASELIALSADNL